MLDNRPTPYEVVELLLPGDDEGKLAHRALAAVLNGRTRQPFPLGLPKIETLEMVRQSIEIKERVRLPGIAFRGHPAVLGDIVLALQAGEVPIKCDPMTRQDFQEYAAKAAPPGVMYVDMTPHIEGIELPPNAPWYDHVSGGVVDPLSGITAGATS